MKTNGLPVVAGLPVITRNQQEPLVGKDPILNFGHIKPHRAGEPHAEGLVLSAAIKPSDLRLEYMWRR